jgi:hypothetical protein
MKRGKSYNLYVNDCEVLKTFSFSSLKIPDFQKLDKWEDINKTDGHDITEILFKVEFTINQTTVVNRILSVNKIYYIRK